MAQTQEDYLELKSKLNQETAIIEWKALELFFAKGQIIVVEPSLDLIETACSFVNDEKEQIKEWMNDHLVFKAETDWVKNNCTEATQFWTVVVAPFVMIQQTEKNSDAVDD